MWRRIWRRRGGGFGRRGGIRGEGGMGLAVRKQGDNASEGVGSREWDFGVHLVMVQ